ncbi:MAG: hypothetical protein HKN47_18605 [Pirellulaceae bacterium]|nr:hypothetical protein [Pirellulaceae bacterium]
MLLRLAKWMIALAVAVGLVLATRSALDQWQHETDKIQRQIAELDQQIALPDPPTDRDSLIQQRDRLIANIPSLQNLGWDKVALSALLYAIGIFFPGLVLHDAVRSLGARATYGTAIASQLLGHAGKYVPGKAMVIVLRAGGLSVDGVQPIRATISVFMETLLMMGVGATLACIVIFWLPVPTWMTWSALAVAVLASVPTIPPILKRVAARVAKMTPSDFDFNDRGSSSLGFFLTGWAWSLVSWLFIGASFTAIVLSIPSVTASPPSLLVITAVSTAAIALAIVIGFASLLPGGAGVRELVITTILATSIGTAHALLAAIAARIMFIAVEAICAGAAWWWLRRSIAAQSLTTAVDPMVTDTFESTGD